MSLKDGLTGPCDTTEISVHPNPESKYIEAVVYTTGCGATTSIGPIVAFRTHSGDGYVNIFVPHIVSPLTVEWTNKSVLKISSPSAGSDLKVI